MDENWYAVEYEVREQLRRARTGMLRDPYLMDPYIQEAVRREHIAEALREAARESALRRAASESTPSRSRAVIQRLAQAAASLGLKRRIEDGNAKEPQEGLWAR